MFNVIIRSSSDDADKNPESVGCHRKVSENKVSFIR